MSGPKVVLLALISIIEFKRTKMASVADARELQIMSSYLPCLSEHIFTYWKLLVKDIGALNSMNSSPLATTCGHITINNFGNHRAKQPAAKTI